MSMPGKRPVLYREDLARVSLAGLRRSWKPSKWRELNAVRIEHGGHLAVVSIIVEPCPTAHGGTRRWLRCPSCGGRAQTLGCHPELGWSCAAARCGAWRGRRRRAAF